jgi:hypothetical protein
MSDKINPRKSFEKICRKIGEDPVFHNITSKTALDHAKKSDVDLRYTRKGSSVADIFGKLAVRNPTMRYDALFHDLSRDEDGNLLIG